MALEKHELEKSGSGSESTIDMLAESKVLAIGEDEPTANQNLYARFFNDASGRQLFSLRWYLNILMKNTSVSFQLVLSSFFVQMFALWMPVFYIVIFDRVYGRYNLATLDVLAVGIILVVGFDIIIKMLRSYLMSHQMDWLDKLTSEYLITKLTSKASITSANKAVSSLPDRFIEMLRVNKTVTQTLFMTLLDTAFSTIVIFILIKLNFTLAMVSLLPLIPLGLYFFWHTPKARARSRNYAKEQKQCQMGLSELVTHRETLMSVNAQKNYQNQVLGRVNQFITGSFATHLDMTGQSNVQGFFINLGSMLTLYVGAHVVLSGEINFGVYIAINMISRTVMGTFQRFLASVTEYQEMSASMDNLKEALLDSEASLPAQARQGKAIVDHIDGELKFHQVQYCYPNTEKNVLNDISFEVKPGERIVITGKSGCGKSTLVRLMQNLIQPTGGYITVDEINILDIQAVSLREKIGAAVQKPAMFAGTLEENLLLGNPDAKTQDVIQTANLCGMADMLNESKDGLNTTVLPMGVNLSGGQTQRISLARVLLKNPDLLILDEALTALPPAMRVEIINGIHKSFKGKTCIFVSNFIPLHQVADRILVLDEGKIIESGTFKELIDKKGAYFELNHPTPPKKDEPIQAGGAP